MIEVTFVKLDCPYCGKENKLNAERYPAWWATACDEEVGGCGKIFVYKTVLLVGGKTKKVEGEE